MDDGEIKQKLWYPTEDAGPEGSAGQERQFWVSQAKRFYLKTLKWKGKEKRIARESQKLNSGFGGYQRDMSNA